MNDLNWKKINRVEVIDHYAKPESEEYGRVYNFWEDEGMVEVAIDVQNDGRTLKVFIRRTAKV